MAAFVAVHLTPWPPTSEPKRAVRATRDFGTLVVFFSSGMAVALRHGTGRCVGSPPMPGPLLAVDAPSLLYRAFYALPKSIKGTDGAPVNALLGTANLLLQAVEAHQPRATVLCFGAEAATYRVEHFAGYHADRPEMPELLVPQWSDAPAFYAAFGWMSLNAGDLEADDLLGSLAEHRDRGRRRDAAVHERPRHVPVRRRSTCASWRRRRAAPSCSDPTRSVPATGSSPGRSRT